MSKYISNTFSRFGSASLLDHNERTQKEPSYLLKEEHRFSNFLQKNSKAEFLAMKEEAEKDMKKQRKGKRGGIRGFKKDSNPLAETVIGLGREQTLLLFEKHGVPKAQKMIDDCMRKLALAIEKEMGLTFISANGHYDEGHQKSGKPNYHYHLSFLDYDFINHRTVMRRFRKKNPIWSKLQDLAYENFKEIGYIRGEVGSNKKHLKAKEYRNMKEDTEKETLKEIDQLDNVLLDLTLEELQAKKEEFKGNKLMKRLVDYAYRFKKLEQEEKRTEELQKPLNHINKTLDKLADGQPISKNEAEFMKSLFSQKALKGSLSKQAVQTIENTMRW